MSDDIKLSALRLPLDLHAKIAAAAETNGRSRHAEMLHRMEASFNVPDAAPGYATVDASGLTEVFTTCFKRLEERVIAALTPPEQIIKLDFGMDDSASAEQLRAYMANEYPNYFFPETEGRTGDDDPYHLLRRFESAGWKGTRSPTGRLSESQPELQDLPPVSGLGTLAASLRKRGCMCGGGVAGETSYRYHGCVGDLQSQPLNFGGFYNVGFCGMPEGELPKILERGEPVIDWSEYKQMAGRGIGWIENTGSRPADLMPDVEIEIMTRPHGHTHKHLVGDIHPSSWVSHDHKLPLISKWRPTTVTVNVVNTADSDGWIENTGVVPEGVKVGTRLDFKLSGGSQPVLGHEYGVGKSKGPKIWTNQSGKTRMTHWRFSKEAEARKFGDHVAAQVLADAEKMAGTHGYNGNTDGWTENTGSMPVPPTTGVQVMVDGKIGRTGKASSFEWSLEDDAEPGDISHWRLAQ